MFIGVNFSKLTHNNQIFRNDFVCNHYHLCKLLAQNYAGLHIFYNNTDYNMLFTTSESVLAGEKLSYQKLITILAKFLPLKVSYSCCSIPIYLL